jgi:hypothetical protein
MSSKENKIEKAREEKEYPAPLVPRITDCVSDTISDALLLVMNEIQDTLNFCNAIPGQDYTHQDLVNWALPFVLDRWNKGKIRLDAVHDDLV